MSRKRGEKKKDKQKSQKNEKIIKWDGCDLSKANSKQMNPDTN